MDPAPRTPPSDGDEDLMGPWETDATVIGSPSSITPQQYPAGLTSRELAHALRGEMLGHFLLQQFIGGGGMGVVFKALDTTLDRIVAVKVVASHHIDNEDLQRRFLIEAQSTARLDHANIARVHYIGRDRGLPYIVFEYIDGMNLREMAARRGPLPVSEALSYVYQIAHALAHAWQRDVVHRDIKPSNILVTPDGQAKLVDMGLARLTQVDARDEELTATGITLGTFDYISPEQARDPRSADTRSDIYSLGCTLFFMLAGQAPFANGTAVQKLLDHQGERPPDLRNFRSDIPDSVSQLVRQMLAKAPGDRQQSPFELVAQLEEVLHEIGAPLPPGAAPLQWTASALAPPRWRRHAAWMVPAATLLLVGFALDRFSRDDAVAAPFPELRLKTADKAAPMATPQGDQTAALGALGNEQPPSAVAAPLATTQQAPASETGASASSILDGPLALGRDWGLGRTLWELGSDLKLGGEQAADLPATAELAAPVANDGEGPEPDGAAPPRAPAAEMEVAPPNGPLPHAETPPAPEPPR